MAIIAGVIVWPLDAHLAALTAAYSMLKCASVYAALCWSGSVLTQGQISAGQKNPAVDFQLWVQYVAGRSVRIGGALR